MSAVTCRCCLLRLHRFLLCVSRLSLSSTSIVFVLTYTFSSSSCREKNTRFISIVTLVRTPTRSSLFANPDRLFRHASFCLWNPLPNPRHQFLIGFVDVHLIFHCAREFVVFQPLLLSIISSLVHPRLVTQILPTFIDSRTSCPLFVIFVI